MSYSNKPVALITGSTKGIGRGCAIALAKKGFNVAINGRNNEESINEQQLLVKELQSLGGDALACTGDVSDLLIQTHLLDKIINKWGRLDCLVNNAGTGAKQRGDLLDITPENYDYCQNINTKSMFFLSQKAAKLMLSQGEITKQHRSIINITSCSAQTLSISRSEYCISKAAASMATQLLALRLAEEKIGVYEIRPGIIATDMTKAVKPKYDALIANGLVPMKRWGQPEDIANIVTAAALGLMTYTIGQIFEIDGGLCKLHF